MRVDVGGGGEGVGGEGGIRRYVDGGEEGGAKEKDKKMVIKVEAVLVEEEDMVEKEEPEGKEEEMAMKEKDEVDEMEEE